MRSDGNRSPSAAGSTSATSRPWSRMRSTIAGTASASGSPSRTAITYGHGENEKPGSDRSNARNRSIERAPTAASTSSA